MCRLYGFRANEPTKVECTLVYAQNALLLQSRSDQRGLSHPDGWGIAFYEGRHPVVQRRDRAAFTDLSFSLTAARVNARTVVAHVRQATVSEANLANTHPFVHGRWTFAHNGTLTGFDALRPRLWAETVPALRGEVRGTTDSESIFYWLLSRMAERGISVTGQESTVGPTVDVIRAALVRLGDLSAGTGVEDPPQLNLLLTNGEILVASRWGRTLHFVEREAVHDCEICGIPHSATGHGEYRAVVLASEPISSEAWEEVADGSVVSVDEDVRLRVQAI